MENTLENKAKFFAQYWGQDIIEVNTKEWQTFNKGVTRPIHSVTIESDSFDKFILLLKPLSQITDEDAIEICKLQGYDPNKIKALDIHFDLDLQDEFTVCLQTSHHDNYDVVNINTIDYLRSRGYALPFNGVSVETQVEYGWTKLKTVD